MTNPPTDERRESGRLTHKDGEVLDWIRERLVNVHGDDTNADFIHALERVRLRVHAQAALSHQGEVLYGVENRGLRKGLRMGYEMGQEGQSELFNTTLASWEREAKEMRQESQPTALISKAEKV